MLRMGTSAQKVTARKGKQRLRIAYYYESDFSSDIDSFVESSGVDSFVHGQSIGGESNALLVNLEAAVGKFTRAVFRRTISEVPDPFEGGQTHEINLRYYIPSTNDEVLFMDHIKFGGGNITVDSGAVTTNVWHSFTQSFTTSTGSSVFTINMNEDHESGAVDKVYIKDIKLRQL